MLGEIDFLPHMAFGRVCYAVLVLVKIDWLFNAAGEELKLGWWLKRVLVAFGEDVVRSRGGGGLCRAEDMVGEAV